jgi:hypothetical protein
MLSNHKFDISKKVQNAFRLALRDLVEELKEKQGLFPQTLTEYFDQLGDILFSEDIDETEIVSFMAPISEYLINKEELRYPDLFEEYDDVE